MKFLLIAPLLLAMGCQRSILITPTRSTAPAVRAVIYGQSGKKYIKGTLLDSINACVAAEKQCKIKYLSQKGGSL
jgi:hypothetical protein